MLRPFLGPVGHLWFNDSGILAISARAQFLASHLAKETLIPGLDLLMRDLRQLALQGPQRVREREPVGVLARHHRRIMHHTADDIVRQDQSVDLLHHACGRLAPNRDRAGLLPKNWST